MLEYEKHIEDINKSKPPNREDRIMELWRYMGDDIHLDEAGRIAVRDYILSIYEQLNFNEKHAALQVLLKSGGWSNGRDFIFDYLGEIFCRFKSDAALLSTYLYVLQGYDDWRNELDIGAWELDETFREAYERLKAGNSRHLD
ncbi:hypothetical protein [Acidovorax sp. FG27]|uniref:hypothetical protein n=1 Tax=Acidovorax sp. FG27 TaxID=3133652 RepID=UPI0030E893C4